MKKPSLFKTIKYLLVKQNNYMENRNYFYKLHKSVIDAQQLTMTAKMVLMILQNRAEYYNNKPFYCYESWIAGEIHRTERTVKRMIKVLEANGYIHIDRVYNKTTKKTTNFYTIIDFESIHRAEIANENHSGIMNEEKNNEEPRVFDWDSIVIPQPQPQFDGEDDEEAAEAYYNSPEFAEQLRREEEYMRTHNEYDELIEEDVVEDETPFEDEVIPVEVSSHDNQLIEQWRADCKLHCENYVNRLAEGTHPPVALKVLGRNLQPTFDRCINAGISDDELLRIKDNIISMFKRAKEREYANSLLWGN